VDGKKARPPVAEDLLEAPADRPSNAIPRDGRVAPVERPNDTSRLSGLRHRKVTEPRDKGIRRLDGSTARWGSLGKRYPWGRSRRVIIVALVIIVSVGCHNVDARELAMTVQPDLRSSSQEMKNRNRLPAKPGPELRGATEHVGRQRSSTEQGQDDQQVPQFLAMNRRRWRRNTERIVGDRIVFLGHR
jgi:hypothetical protein